jgi:hypothetical protein
VNDFDFINFSFRKSEKSSQKRPSKKPAKAQKRGELIFFFLVLLID